MNTLMPIDGIEDFAARIQRFDATFDYELLDRPAICMYANKDNAKPPLPMDLRKWDDIDYRLNIMIENSQRIAYYGDALPTFSANIGPDVFPCGFGGELAFEETTSFIKPYIQDLDEILALHYDHQRHYIKVMDELYEGMKSASQGRFYVEMPDFHPNGDCLAAMRGSQNLCLDCLDIPEKFPAVMKHVTQEYFQTYDWYRKPFKDAGHVCTSWIGINSCYDYSIPSCDFAYMISPGMFDELILPSIIAECQHFERNIFHVDGIGVLNHLDSLLEVPNLQMFQWVFGANGGKASDWIPVYKKCQAHHKGIMILLELDELETIMDNLSPRGVYIKLDGVEDPETASAVLKRLEKWKDVPK